MVNSVVLAAVVDRLSSLVLHRIVLRLGRPDTGTPPPSALLVELRLRLWVTALLSVANVSMLVVLAVANLRTPSIAGPVGLAFILLCLFTVLLAYQVHRAATRLRVSTTTLAATSEGS